MRSVHGSAQVSESELSTSDLKRLLSSLGIAVVIVDRRLRVRLFTPSARILLNLIATDIGRPIGDLRWNLEIAGIDDQLRECAARGTTAVRDVRDRDGLSRTLSIRPSRSASGRPAGVILLLSDAHGTQRSSDYLDAQAQRQVDELLLMHELLADAPSIQAGAPVLIESIGRLVDWPTGELWVLDLGTHTLQPSGSWQRSDSTPARTTLTGSSFGDVDRAAVARSVLTRRKPIWIVQRRSGGAAGGRQESWQSVFACPVRRGSQVVGVLELFDAQRRTRDVAFQHQMERMSRYVGIWLQHKFVEEALRTREDEYRKLSGRLLRMQDEERRRIARDLHDSTLQRLSGLIMNLDVVGRDPRRLDRQSRRALSESRSLAEQSSREIRTLTYLLHPPLLDEKGLASAVRWYASGFSERSRIRVSLSLADVGRLPMRIEEALYRIVQESLTNIHRHARSRTASISLAREADLVTLEVRDRGRGLRGMPSMAIASPGSLGVGIQSMRERVHQLGGTFEMESSRTGTTVHVRMPLKDNGRDNDPDPDRRRS